MSDGLSPQQKLETNLLELEGDIRLKKREHDEIAGDLDKLQRIKSSQVKQKVNEISSLIKKRDEFALEIKKLLNVFSDMKDKRIGLEEALELFTNEEFSSVSVVAREVLDDIYLLRKKNRRRAKRISIKEDVLSKTALSLTKLKKELGDKEKELLSNGRTLKNEMQVVLKKERLLIKQAEETKESLLEATRARVEAKTKLDKAGSILKQAGKKKEKMDKTLNLEDKRLKSHSKVLQAEKRGLGTREKGLILRQRRLRDKEISLRSAEAEIKSKGVI